MGFETSRTQTQERGENVLSPLLKEREEKLAEIQKLEEAVQKSNIESIRQQYDLGTTSEAKAWIERRVVENEARIREIDTKTALVPEREEKIAEIERLNEAVQTSQIESIRQEHDLGTTSEAKAWIERRVVENEARIREIDTVLTGTATKKPEPMFTRREQPITEISGTNIVITESNEPSSTEASTENTSVPETKEKTSQPEVAKPTETQKTTDELLRERQEATKARIERLRAIAKLNEAIADLNEAIPKLRQAKSEVSYMSPTFIAYAKGKLGATDEVFSSEASAYMWVEKMIATLSKKQEQLNLQTKEALALSLKTLKKERANQVPETARTPEETSTLIKKNIQEATAVKRVANDNFRLPPTIPKKQPKKRKGFFGFLRGLFR